MFNNSQIFKPAMPAQNHRTLLLKTNGGRVIIEALLDEATDLWVRTDEKATDGGFVLACGNAVLRVTPNGGAQYDVI